MANLQKGVRKWVQECSECQQSKANRQTNSLISSLTAHVHIILVDPFPRYNDFTYLFTCIERFTRLPTAIPINELQLK